MPSLGPNRVASGRCTTKSTIAEAPLRTASASSKRCRRPLSVGASGKRATLASTNVTDLTSRKSLLFSRSSRKSERPCPNRGSRAAILQPLRGGMAPSSRASGKKRLGRVESIETNIPERSAPIAVQRVFRFTPSAFRRRILRFGVRISGRRPGLGRWASSRFPFSSTHRENLFGRSMNFPQTLSAIAGTLTRGAGPPSPIRPSLPGSGRGPGGPPPPGVGWRPPP